MFPRGSTVAVEGAGTLSLPQVMATMSYISMWMAQRSNNHWLIGVKSARRLTTTASLRRIVSHCDQGLPDKGIGKSASRWASSLLLATALCAPFLSAQTVPMSVGQPVNAYSFLRPGLPNYGIAQGSIFTVLGTGMAETTASQDVPLQSRLEGVSIEVVINGITTRAIPYYVSPGQINGLLPPNTPVGDGTIAVTSRGHTASASIHVVRSAFGMLTQFDATNIAVVQNASQGGELLSDANAANPGEYLVLWGSGLGPVEGDESQYQDPHDLNIPVEVTIGGVSRTVTYHGRSAYPGLDQINVIVPAGVSGCYVSVVVVAGGVPGNFATIPVSSNGRTCADPGLIPITPDEYNRLLSLDHVNAGAISLTKLNTDTATSDSASAVLQKYVGERVRSSGVATHASLGSCIVLHGGRPDGPPPYFLSTPPGQLNAGPQIHVNGPNGSVAMVPRYPGYAIPGGAGPQIIPQAGGSFGFDNGSGGPDLGPFTATLSASLTNPFVWTNRSAITALDRSNGQVVTWTGGIPGSYVSIFGYTFAHENSPGGNGSDEYTSFTCSAPASAGQFTVPAAVLGSVLPSATSLGAGLPPAGNGYFYVVNGTSQRFSAPGLDLGLLFFNVGTGISVPFN